MLEESSQPDREEDVAETYDLADVGDPEWDHVSQERET
jgi:hypothetical protein